MFTLDDVVLWGRSFDEYCRMFSLGDKDLRLRILGCADGPASFNAEATRRGATVISSDPIYRWQTAAIREQIGRARDQILDEVQRNADDFVWDYIPSVEELDRVRMAAMADFLDDLDEGRQQGRYVEAELPDLPFGDRAFDLALCSHFLFLYSHQLGLEFHVAALRELCRLAADVRVFPLLAIGGQPSPLVEECCDALRAAGHTVSIETVHYEFQRGGNQMMRVRTIAGGIDEATASEVPCAE